MAFTQRSEVVFEIITTIFAPVKNSWWHLDTFEKFAKTIDQAATSHQSNHEAASRKVLMDGYISSISKIVCESQPRKVIVRPKIWMLRDTP